MKVNRRSLLKILASTVAVAPLFKLGKLMAEEKKKECPTAAPADVKVVTADDAAGKRLDYVVDATTSKNAKYKAGQNCENCKFYTADKGKDGYAPCKMLANKYVAGCGWCKSYQANKA
jgi:hypothetical protein